MIENIRFIDENLAHSEFWNRILVECPKCNERAEVSYNRETIEAQLHCFNCHHIEKDNDFLVINQFRNYCPNCRSVIEFEMETKKKLDKMQLKCSECGENNEFKPTCTFKKLKYQNKGRAAETFFYLPFWLQGQIKNDTFWAYNHEHLAYLKKYIEAKIRVRANVTNSTMLEKLPQFIKSAKNRDSLLKLIGKLELKV